MKWYTTRFIVMLTIILATGLSAYLESAIPFTAVVNGALLALINHKHQETKQLNANKE